MLLADPSTAAPWDGFHIGVRADAGLAANRSSTAEIKMCCGFMILRPPNEIERRASVWHVVVI
jgi:hypothetical protein